MINCKKCNKEFDDRKPNCGAELSHNVPKWMRREGEKDTDNYGREYLCKKCHGILEWMIIKKVWKENIDDYKKEVIRQNIKRFSEWWISLKD